MNRLPLPFSVHEAVEGSIEIERREIRIDGAGLFTDEAKPKATGRVTDGMLMLVDGGMTFGLRR